MKKFSVLKKTLFVFAFICFFTVGATFAQPGEPGGGPGAGEDPVGAGVPLDGGSLLLLIAGVTYGAKQLKKKKEVVVE